MLIQAARLTPARRRRSRRARPRRNSAQTWHNADPKRTGYFARLTTGCHRFPLNNFKYFLTLFSKFFSSFPHGTCSLSVSRGYLALDEIYHPFRVAFPNNSTLRKQTVRGELPVKDGILTLYDTLFQKIYTEVTRWSCLFRLQLDVPLGTSIFKLSSSRFTRRY